MASPRRGARTIRKGARTMADIPPAIVNKLNKGEMEAATLVEVLIVDFAKLMKSAFPTLDPIFIKEMKAAKELGWVGRTKLAGDILYRGLGKKALKLSTNHPSDQVRGWGASLVAAIPDLDLEERLSLMRHIADETNAGTREVAWISLRPHVAVELSRSIDVLRSWAVDPSANIRRFASEITRPRGVWCTHIPELRKNPKLGLPILQTLCADQSRYVQNSVANWLNDASKDNPAFVRQVCQLWAQQSKTQATAYICKRAQRTLNKKL
jgi:3-methyladenine DNA glycosylase AlkC